MKRILALVLALCLLSAFLPVYAAGTATYYISPSGSDENSGTDPAHPFRTVAPINRIGIFSSGTSILFEGGYRYAGGLYLKPAGRANAPVVISSYGQGTATLTDENGTDRPILECHDAQHVVVRNLSFAGTPGTGEYPSRDFRPGNSSWALYFGSSDNGRRLKGITLENLSVTDTFGGVEIRAAGSLGYDGIAIRGCTLDGVVQYGLFVMGAGAFAGGSSEAHRNVTIERCRITRLYGDPNTSAEAQAICVAGAQEIRIERNFVRGCGGYGGMVAGENEIGGATAIGVANCRHFSILANEITETASFSDADGSAIDIDQDAQRGEVAGNLTYHNGGPAIQLGSFSAGGAQLWAGQVDIHHNISYNDAQGLREKSEQGALRFFGNVKEVNAFNNTIVLTEIRCGTPSCVNFERHPLSALGNTDIRFFNNLFRVQRLGDGVMPVIVRSNRVVLPSSIAASVRFFHNFYDSAEQQITLCNDPLISDGIAPVQDRFTGSLSDWQALGQEHYEGRAVGLVGDSGLRNLSQFSTPPMGTQAFSAITAFDVASDSLAFSGAMDPWELAPQSREKTDFCGQSGTVRAYGAVGSSGTPGAHEHGFDAWRTVREADCEQPGLRERVCAGCGQTETEEIPALGHRYAAWRTIREADCEQPGERERVCIRCGHRQAEELPALGHRFADPVVLRESTLWQTGREAGTCSRCGKSTEQETPCRVVDSKTGIILSCAEGVFPEGSVLMVEALTEDEREALEKAGAGRMEGVRLLVRVGETAVAPRGTVTISLPIPAGYGAEAFVMARNAQGDWERPDTRLSEDGTAFVWESERLGVVAVCLPGEQPDEGGFPWWGWALPGAAILAAGIVGFFLQKRKRS